MDRSDFEQLRDLPGKVVRADIEFRPDPKTGPVLVFDQVRIENGLGWDVVLNGTYKPWIPPVTYNFVLRGVGPICRVEVNGKLHGNAGRTHKHDLRSESDPANNLPVAALRADLHGMSAREIWDMLCVQANIAHTGRFVDPV